MKTIKLVLVWLVFALALPGCAVPVYSVSSTATPAPEAPRNDAPDAARLALAGVLGIDPDDVQVISFEQVDFPDGCLGISNPAVSCLAAITPGYRIILEAQGAQFEYRAPLDASYVVPVNAMAAEAEPALIWRRTGGIAGFCDVLEVTPNGEANALSCDGAALGSAVLSEQELGQVLAWQQTYATFQYGQSDGAVADGMNIQLTLYGQGTLAVDDAAKAEMQQFAAGLFVRATDQAALPPAEPTPETAATDDGPPISQAAAGIITGRVCYPSEYIPAMTAYFLNTLDATYTEVAIAENQGTYEVNLAPGEYVAFAYVDEYKLGGGYTEYVACGYAETCTDHSLKPIVLGSGTAAQDVDLCDWILDGLPLPEE